MCRKKIYYNTYADGMKDVTEKTTACREGKICSHPEIHQYERTFRFNKLRDAGPESQKSLSERKPTPYFLGELPTPRGSKSPSPAGRRGSGVYVPGSGLLDVPQPSRDDRRHDRHDRHSSHHRHSSRHADREPPSSRPKRSSQPHYVVIDQPGRGVSRDIPLGPVHLVDEYGRSRRSSRERHHDRDHDRHHRHRSPSSSSQGYIVDDERERRRHQKGRRMSTSGYPDVAGGAVPTMADVYTAEPRRHASLRRSNTLGAGTSLGASPPRVRWEDEVTARRARQNAEIASRNMAPEVHQEPPKGILKDTSGGKGKGRESTDVRELRRAVEGMGVHSRGGRGDEYDLYNRDRLRARLGGGGADDESGRDRRRRSKVWVAGDQYQYF